MKIVAIIQARMGSTRLEEKIFKKLCDKEVLMHIAERTKHAKLIDQVVVATTLSSRDDAVEKLCISENIKCFRGSEDNVLERFYQCAEKYEADVIVRVTADDPLKDPEVIDYGLNIFLNGNYDYVSNTVHPTYPEGLDIEIFSFEALKRAYKEAELLSEKEHVTPYIWKNTNRFKVFNFESDKNLSYMRWTMDTEEDFIFMEKIYGELYNKEKIFLMHDVLELLNKHPEYMEINAGHVRNEGYLKSLKIEEGK